MKKLCSKELGFILEVITFIQQRGGDFFASGYAYILKAFYRLEDGQ